MRNWKLFLFAAALSMGCRKPYNPGVISSPASYLIVEGVINTNDVTTIKLSKTVNLSSAVTTNPVDNANLFIEDDNGNKYGLDNLGSGSYQLADITLDETRKFRLDIQLNSQNYQSDYEQAKVTPPVDSVGFIADGNKLRIYANTHDPKNNTHYYRFDYVETWRFHAKYFSAYYSNGDTILPRHPEQDIYFCFANNTSSTIILGSSAKLSQDVLFQAPLTAIESTSEKIENRYSILVRQYALTETGYKFYENLKRNTEQLGSIFDAEPSQISGNIHNLSDPKEIVVGYVSAGTVSSKRIFISREELPDSWRTKYPYDCSTDSSLYDNPKTHVNQVAQNLLTGIEVPVAAIFGPGGPSPIGYTGSDRNCVDCTIRGTKQTPPFWK